MSDDRPTPEEESAEDTDNPIESSDAEAPTSGDEEESEDGPEDEDAEADDEDLDSELSDEEAEQQAQADAEVVKDVKRKRWLRLKWKRRIAWIFVILFGAGVYKVVSDLTKVEPKDEIDHEQQKALKALIPIPIDAALPLEKTWLPMKAVPFPARGKERPLPKVKVPRVVMLPVTFRYDAEVGSKPTPKQLEDGKDLVRGLDLLLRRDLDLVDGIALLGPSLTPPPNGTLTRQAEVLRQKFRGMDVAVRFEVIRDKAGLELVSEYMTLDELGTARSGPRERAPEQQFVTECRKVVKNLVPRLRGSLSREALKRIESFTTKCSQLKQTGTMLKTTPAGQLSTGYERNALLTIGQLRRMGPLEASVPLNSVRANDPYYVEAHWRSEWALPEDSGHEAGLKHCQRALSYSPQCGPAHLRHSARLLAQGRSGPALKKGVLALFLMPPSPPAHANLARIYLRRNAPGLTRRFAEKALELDPYLPQGREALFDAWIALDQIGKALKVAEQYAEDAKKSPAAFACRVRALRFAGKHREAGELLSNTPKGLLKPFMANLLNAEQLYWTGKLAEARKRAVKVLDQRARNRRAKALLQAIDEFLPCKTAVHALQTPATIAKFRVLDMRAGINQKLGRMDVLRSIVSQMRSLAPDDPQTLRWRAKMLAHDGRQFEGLESLEKLVSVTKQLRPDDLDELVEALVCRARFKDAKKAMKDHLHPKKEHERYMRLGARIAMLEGLFHADRLQDYKHALQAMKRALRRDNTVENMRAVIKRAERYMNLLVKAGRIEDAKRVPATVNGPMDDKHKRILEDALGSALAKAPKKKK